jgi:short-subunit dehydrogenase
MKDPRSILITGASSGIGAALAKQYAAAGVSLALTGRDAVRLSAVADACRSAGAQVQSATLEIDNADEVAGWIASVDVREPLDLVIANAGINSGSAPNDVGESLADVERLMRVNFCGACNTLMPALAAMRPRKRGQLALMSSLAALHGLPYSPAYCASKAALKIYGESLRAKLRSEGIEVSVILPGFVDTPMSRRVSAPKPLQMSAERAARLIRNGLAHRRPTIAFPWPLYAATRLLRVLPAAVVDPILNRVQVEIRPYERAES